MSSAGLALLVALLLTGLEPAWLRLGCRWLLVGLLSLGLLYNLGAWRWTSELTRRFLEQMQQMEPAPPPNTVFVVREMPRTVRGVYLLNPGLAEAVKITYDREDLSAARDPDPFTGQAFTATGRPTIVVKWTGAPEKLIERLPQ